MGGKGMPPPLPTFRNHAAPVEPEPEKKVSPLEEERHTEASQPDLITPLVTALITESIIENNSSFDFGGGSGGGGGATGDF